MESQRENLKYSLFNGFPICSCINFKKITNPISMEKKIFWKNVLIGFLGGIVSGFFSSGGGLILVPYLTSVLKMDEVKSRATTIFCIFFMVFTSGLFYFNNDYIDINISIKCAIGGIIGGFLGSKLLWKANKNILKIFFIFFLIYAGLKML